MPDSEGESGLLWDLYKQVVGKDENPEGQGERLHPANLWQPRSAHLCLLGP